MLAVINVIINYNKTLSLFNKPQTNKHEQKSASPRWLTSLHVNSSIETEEGGGAYPDPFL